MGGHVVDVNKSIVLIVVALLCVSLTTLFCVQMIPKHEMQPFLRSRIHGDPPGQLNETVAFIIRSHGGYSNALISMMWGFEAQTKYYRTLALVLPTEYSAIKILDDYLHRHWTHYHFGPGKVVSTTVMAVPKEEYDSHCCHLKTICVDKWRLKLVTGGWTEDAVNRYCEVNSPLHYHLTDSALNFIMNNCSTCRYVVVTNADNSYTPDFLEKTGALMESGEYDIVMVDMLHRGKAMEVAPENGKLDLGCALISVDFLRRHSLSFLSSLPQPAEPQHFHDADFWMIDNCIRHGARVGYVREVLFNHN